MVGLFERIVARDKMSSCSTKEETLVTLENGGARRECY
jgi:hypothetical protein